MGDISSHSSLITFRYYAMWFVNRSTLILTGTLFKFRSIDVDAVDEWRDQLIDVVSLCWG
jgi:hypothetical protein